MCDVMFPCREIYKVVSVIGSANRLWNFMVCLEIFSFKEGVVLLNHTIIYLLIVHIIFTFLLLKSFA